MKNILYFDLLKNLCIIYLFYPIVCFLPARGINKFIFWCCDPRKPHHHKHQTL